MKITKEYNDRLFEENISLIEELCQNNWIPAEIARRIGMDRHSLIDRMRKSNLQINIRTCIATDKKVCCHCKEEKSIEEFAKKKKNSDTYSSRCKSCRKISIQENRQSFMYSQIKNNAKQRGLEFNLTKDDIIIPEYCPILGVPFDLYNESESTRYSPSIDRIDSSRGYVKGNIMVISMKANMMKNDASIDELINFSKYFLAKYLSEYKDTQD